MATGSDAGAPGEHLPEPPLDEDEQRLLVELNQTDNAPALEAVEDSPAVVSAVEDDSPLPSAGGAPDDPDTAQFERPGE
jgi:hypothetical protein